MFVLMTIVAVICFLIVATYLFLQLPSFGKNPSGIRLQRIMKSSQYKTSGFENIEPTMLMAEGTSYPGMMREFFSKGVDREPQADLPFIKTDLTKLENNSLVWFGHSSYLIRVAEKNILVDPVFSERASPVQFAGMRAYRGANNYHAADMPMLDAVILTHDHYDHLDYSVIKALHHKTKVFYTSLGVGQHLERWGVPLEKIIEMDWWQSRTISDTIELIATPARHFSGRGLIRNKTLWSSFVLKTNDVSIFIGGDSGYDQSFKKIGERYGPFDLVILEAGQYDKKWPQIHMAPEEAVYAAIDLKGKVMLPVHWGKFTLALHPWTEPIVRVLIEAQQRNVMVATPMIGETMSLVKEPPIKKWWL